jgi:hypothetical protein
MSNIIKIEPGALYKSTKSLAAIFSWGGNKISSINDEINFNDVWTHSIPTKDSTFLFIEQIERPAIIRFYDGYETAESDCIEIWKTLSEDRSYYIMVYPSTFEHLYKIK